jgi:two-component system, OmpR family, heavy metal sensor histidine kinase CusS
VDAVKCGDQVALHAGLVAAFSVAMVEIFGRAIGVAMGVVVDGHAAARPVKLKQVDAVRPEVRNPGVPIDSLTLEHMFDRFYRADASRAGTRHGYGLGLAIVKAIVRMHGGNVFSSTGDETVVGFTLPLIPSRSS